MRASMSSTWSTFDETIASMFDCHASRTAMPTDLLVRQADSMVQMSKYRCDRLTSPSCSRLGWFC